MGVGEPVVDVGFNIGGICTRIEYTKMLNHTHYVIDHTKFDNILEEKAWYTLHAYVPLFSRFLTIRICMDIVSILTS